MRQRLAGVDAKSLVPTRNRYVGVAALQGQKSAVDEQVGVLRRVLERGFGQIERFLKTVLIDQQSQKSLASTWISRIGQDRPSPGGLRLLRFSIFRFFASQPGLQRTVKLVESRRTLEIVDVVGVQSKVVANLIDGPPNQQQQNSTHSQRSSADRAARQPLPRRSEVAGGLGGGVGYLLARIEEQGCDAPVAQLPNSAIQNEVVNVHQCGEDQETRCEVVMKGTAGEPRTGDE